MPQEGAYEITVQGDTCQKVMPIAKATLSTIKALNGIAGLAQCFFPGLPSIPKSVLDKAKATIDQFDVESSVAEFDEVQSVLAKQDGEREQGKQDGYCHRQFKQLLAKEDPDHNWAKLQRAILAEGKSIWMCEGCAKVLEKPGNKDRPYEELRELCKPKVLADFKVDEGALEAVIGGGGGGGGGAGSEVGGEGVEVERPSSEATLLELERLKAEIENQKQLLVDAQNQNQLLINAHQNQETEAPPTITEGNVPDMAAELREDMKAIKAQLSQLDDVKAIKEELGELKAKQQGVNDELFNLRKGFFWIQSPMRTTPP